MAIVLDGTDSIGDLGDALNAKLNLAGGKVLQIVRATDATQRTTTSTSFVDASISVTITPTKNTSAVLLIWSASAEPNGGNPVYQENRITDSSNNPISGAQEMEIGSDNATGTYHAAVLIGYATPATISAVTYKGQFRANTGVTARLQNALSTGQLYAIEVSA